MSVSSIWMYVVRNSIARGRSQSQTDVGSIEKEVNEKYAVKMSGNAKPASTIAKVGKKLVNTFRTRCTVIAETRFIVYSVQEKSIKIIDQFGGERRDEQFIGVEDSIEDTPFVQFLKSHIFYLQAVMFDDFIGDHLYEIMMRDMFGPDAKQLKSNSVYRKWIFMLHSCQSWDPIPLKKLRENLLRRAVSGISLRDVYHHFACTMDRMNSIFPCLICDGYYLVLPTIDQNKIEEYVSPFNPDMRQDLIDLFMSHE